MTDNSTVDPQAELAELRRKLAEAEARLAAAEAARRVDLHVEGERSVAAGGDIRDSILVTGDRNVVFGSVETVHIDSAVFLAPPDPGQPSPKELLWTYLNQVVYDTGTLDLSGVDRRALGDPQDTRLELAAVYTALDTMRTVERTPAKPGRGRPSESMEAGDRQRQSALAFVAEHQYVALLGDPGSGKSTFANFLALCLAGELLALPQANLARLGEEWSLPPLLPVRVTLRSFAARVEDLGKPAGTLWAYIDRRLNDSVPGFAPLLNRHLVEQGGLLVLDGLDEVPEAHHRLEQVKQAVLTFQRHFPKVRILLTSRTYAYQRQQWRLPAFAEAVLAPFTGEQVDAFVDRWYGHMAQVRPNLGAVEAQSRALLLKEAIRRNPHLQELAPRPLLLILMASLHAWRGGSLPDQREQLYEESVELLMDIWERPKIVLDAAGKPVLQAESTDEWLRCPKERVRRSLEKLAYEVHAGQEATTGAADIREEQLVAALIQAAGDPDLRTGRVVEYIRDRAGLLTNRGEGVYSFPHRTFQEYMAARYLSDAGFPKSLVHLVRADPERWREVLLLAGANVARGTQFAAWSLVQHLCPFACDPGPVAQARDQDWWAVLLAGQLLVETRIHRHLDPAADPVDGQTLARVRAWLAALVSGGHLPPVDRATAGRSLGWLGDPRPGVGVKDGVPEIAWLDVEAGPFTMGSDRKRDSLASDDETPQFACRLITRPYRISRYPITVAQYAAFVAADGYRHAPYWREAAAEGLWQDGRLQCYTWSLEDQDYKQGWVEGAADYGPSYHAPNQPQVGMSWYEALAYCRWLTDVLGHEVRLPTEAEWERAARHTDGRIYPWGDAFDARRCNMAETGVGAPCAVGLFSGGDAKCGAADLSGNVWEWCSTRRRDDYKDYEARVDDAPAGGGRRVLRGGAFHYFARYGVRCASRASWNPDHRNYDLGFRLVSPGL